VEGLETRCVPTFIVSNTGDAGVMDPAFNAPNMGDLRYCIIAANASGGGTIELGFPPGTYGPNNVNSPGLFGGTIVLESALPDLTQNIRITVNTPGYGSGPSWTVGRDSSAATNFPIFAVDAGTTCELDAVICTGGNDSGIKNRGTLELMGCLVWYNTSTGGGGGISNIGGTLTLNNCLISHNTALNGAGISNTVISNNGTLTCNGGEISNNTATGLGGGIDNEGSATLRGRLETY
jgi:fibronectin-binding autotransporter adhesin